MSRPILIRGARQLLTLRGPGGPHRGTDMRNLGIIQDGAVLIVDGLIREVGPTRRLDNLAQSRQALEINVSGKVVAPGFVDCHTHLVGGPARLQDYEMRLAGASSDQIDEAGGGIPAIHRSFQDASVHTMEAQSLRLLKESIRQGTTTIEAKSGYGGTDKSEIKILRTHAALKARLGNVVSTFMTARCLPRSFEGSRGAYVQWVCTHMLPLVRRRKLAEFIDVACEETEFTFEQSRRILACAKSMGFGIKLHAGQYWNTGGIRLAVELEATSVDHAIFFDHADVAALAQSPTIATLLPGPVFYQGSQRYAAARTLIDQGVAIAMGTDYNPETCPTTNMQMIISLACRKMGMTPAEAISAATINAAYAIRQGDRIGSIEYGKQADLIVLGVPDYREIPYHFGVNLIEMTIKNGNSIYQASEVKWPSA
jgi:imidazolonepropionase